MFYTDLSFFLTSIRGLSIALMGLIVTVMGVSAFAASIPLGVLAGKYGRWRLHIVGIVMASAIIAVFALTTNIAVLLAAAVAEGIARRLSRSQRMHCLWIKPKKTAGPALIRCLVLFRV